MAILLGKGEMDAAVRQARAAYEKHQHNPLLLNGIAVHFLKESALNGDALEIAYQIATRVNEVSKGRIPGALASLARATYMKGDKEKAIQLQQDAIAQTANFPEMNPAVKEKLQNTLDSYNAGKLPPAIEDW